jgi:hypothetical protein
VGGAVLGLLSVAAVLMARCGVGLATLVITSMSFNVITHNKGFEGDFTDNDYHYMTYNIIKMQQGGSARDRDQTGGDHHLLFL